MRSRVGWAAVVGSLVVLGCADLFLGPDPADTPPANFESLWNEFDRLYSLFPYKNVDWDSLHAVYRAQVTDATTDQQLFDVLASMLEQLNDGHVYLIAPFAAIASNAPAMAGWHRNFNPDDVDATYLGTSRRLAGGGRFVYGQLSPTVGYLRITTFEDEDFKRIDDWAKEIDAVIAALSANDALVVDVRGNGGGDAFNAQYIADRFADRTRVFAYGMTRDGPRHDDFSAPFTWTVAPQGPRQFTKPVVLLTSRWTASAAERFTLALRVLPTVTLIGDSTQGAFPHAVPRELPNGWSYRVTVGVVLGPNRESYEGMGIPPAVAVNITPADSASHHDTILETALARLAPP
jgi:Peptidase family S41/Tricorn protease C1 domain